MNSPTDGNGRVGGATARAAQRATLAQFLEDRRNELGLELKAVAARCNRSYDWYFNLEGGGRKGVTVTELRLLEEALQLPRFTLVRLADREGL